MAFGDENTKWKPATASFGGIAFAQYKLGIPSFPRHDGFWGSTEKTSKGSQQRMAGRVWVVGMCGRQAVLQNMQDSCAVQQCHRTTAAKKCICDRIFEFAKVSRPMLYAKQPSLSMWTDLTSFFSDSTHTHTHTHAHAHTHTHTHTELMIFCFQFSSWVCTCYKNYAKVVFFFCFFSKVCLNFF